MDRRGLLRYEAGINRYKDLYYQKIPEFFTSANASFSHLGTRPPL